MKSTLIEECIENKMQFSITLKAEDIIELGNYILKKASECESEKLNEEEVFYSVEEVMKLLNIMDRSTLWRWNKKGYLVPSKVGKMLRYRKSDIDNLLKVRE